MFTPRYLIVFDHDIILESLAIILLHVTLWRGQMRKQSDFFTCLYKRYLTECCVKTVHSRLCYPLCYACWSTSELVQRSTVKSSRRDIFNEINFAAQLSSAVQSVFALTFVLSQAVSYARAILKPNTQRKTELNWTELNSTELNMTTQFSWVEFNSVFRLAV